ncbi:Oxygen-dependent coproporphyrinogen-III oxidase [Zancudomyces culisetae]|uniref:coproporphyrinogen oxidase n=1 Tax=Zancudomyces culisetae TaxID=1213189 RepID=A0A1R1PXE2_ZANCU|nr:Oxygen-dependent coproporphyrinogen-III oxidase [Zancudomyces culisetae]|eukprot:OMH85602.1 Oxygen-dependent coproporphyrinogen-III oxidase [Zancudomyces culisetae]
MGLSKEINGDFALEKRKSTDNVEYESSAKKIKIENLIGKNKEGFSANSEVLENNQTDGRENGQDHSDSDEVASGGEEREYDAKGESSSESNGVVKDKDIHQEKSSPISPVGRGNHNKPVYLQVEEFILRMQESLCKVLSDFDGKKYSYDRWVREGHGYGITRVLQGGSVIEKSCVNVSVMEGSLKLSTPLHEIRHKSLGNKDYRYRLAGLTIVIHPTNPFAPSTHANYRYFEMFDAENRDAEPIAYWYGGGADLTPSYVIDEDVVFFHAIHKSVCDKYDPRYYHTFKKKCDEYFYLPNRGECRGVGGIFFDDLDNKPAAELFEFIRDLSRAFLSSYMPILHRRMNTPYTAKNKEWQLIRRGRSAEFNLCFDRGTKFGITNSVRAESILSSIPLNCIFFYNYKPKKGSLEALSQEIFRNPRQWV